MLGVPGRRGGRNFEIQQSLWSSILEARPRGDSNEKGARRYQRTSSHESVVGKNAVESLYGGCPLLLPLKRDSLSSSQEYILPYHLPLTNTLKFVLYHGIKVDSDDNDVDDKEEEEEEEFVD